MQAPRTIFLGLFFSVLVSVGFSQQKWPNTFLWRVSGNGLSKPSYLYGTMHLQDKRLFQFSDSLYHSLENVEGFALEINFDEFMDTVLSHSFRDAEDEYLEKQRVKVDRKIIDKTADSILKSLHIKPEKLTKKDLKKIRELRMNNLLQQGEMQTIVDGYLYGLALRLGKWTGGIEDVVDQLDVLDELGRELTPENVFIPEKKFRSAVQKMIDIYVSHDLETLAKYVDDDESKDPQLNRRNIKMSRRMDSLAHLRTMFFAIGAAHLAGDSGVINLLRNRGFIVEPIFSPQSMQPELYASKLNTIPWKKIENELYTIDMPGAASDFNLLGEVVKMKLFFDLPTMTIYMAGQTITTSATATNLDNMLQKMAERMGNQNGKIKTKDISDGMITGREGLVQNADGAYKIRLLQSNKIIYILMAGSTKKSNLNDANLGKFFSSFHLKTVEATNRSWTNFSIPGKGFSIQLPGIPKPNKLIDRKAEGSQWAFFTYDMADNDKGLYWMIQVREIERGYFLEEDTTFFSFYKNGVMPSVDKILNEEQFDYSGWRAFKLDFSFKPQGIYRIYSIQRGGRLYMIAAAGDKDADLSDLDKAFHSFRLEEYPQTERKRMTGEGFSTTAASSFTKAKKDSTEKREHFISYDSVGVVSYELFRSAFSPYYWASSDSSFFESKLNDYKEYKDSVLEKRFTYNGTLKGIDFVIQKPGNNAVRKLRLFVKGDSLYNLVSIISRQYVDENNFRKFFDDFRVDNEQPPSIYTSKAKALLDALKNGDSAQSADAARVFYMVPFSKGDLPVLHNGLLESYPEAENYFTTNEKIVNVLKNLADSSTIRFISSNYEKLGGEKEKLKYYLLEVLAKMRTGESYSLLKELLLQHLPAAGSSTQLRYSFDSLKLTASLFPEILSLSKDSVFAELLIGITGQLLDSNLISFSSVLPYRQNFLNAAKKDFLLLQQDEDKWWSFTGWPDFIRRFNDKASNDLLNEFLTLKEANAKYEAMLALLKNGQPIPAKEIEKLAEDKNYRSLLYGEFQKKGKQHLFPERFSSQQKIAESELFQVVMEDNDDNEPTSISFIGERTAMFMGEKKKFYLFRITYESDGESDSNLGITGPYSLDQKGIVTSTKAAGVYWDDKFDKKKIDEQLKEYLLSTEEYLKESEHADDDLKK